jgi:hypothetical protein
LPINLKKIKVEGKFIENTSPQQFHSPHPSIAVQIFIIRVLGVDIYKTLPEKPCPNYKNNSSA